MEEELDLRSFLATIAKHKTLIWVLFLVSILASLSASLLMDPVYEASTTIMVDSSPSMDNPLDETLNLNNPRVADVAAILRSRSLLYAVANKYGLVTGEYPEELDELSESIFIQPINGTNLVRITMEHTDPVIAKDMVNDLATEFISENQSHLRDTAVGARRFIEQQLKTVGEELAVAEDQLRRYRQENKVFSPAQEVGVVLDQLARLETMQAETTVSQREADTRLDQINAQLSREQAKVISSTTITQNPLIRDLKAKLANLEIELSGAAEKYTEKHPSVLALKAQIAEVTERMRQEADRVVSAETETLNPRYQELYRQAGQLQVELLALEVRQTSLNSLIAEKERTFQGFPEKELELTNLIRNAKVTEEIYTLLKQKYEEVRLAEAMKAANVRIIDPALLPIKPIRPSIPLNIVIAGLLGIFVAIGLAFVFEALDASIKTAEQIDDELKLPVLGQIPLVGDSPTNPDPRRNMFLAAIIGLALGVSLAFTMEFVATKVLNPKEEVIYTLPALSQSSQGVDQK